MQRACAGGSGKFCVFVLFYCMVIDGSGFRLCCRIFDESDTPKALFS